MNSLYTFASTETAEKADLFGVLGIDWRLLILQTIAFLIMFWVLKKFAYPPLTKALDERQKTIEESLKAAKEAESKAEKSQEDIEKLLADARSQASDIIATAKTEATAAIEGAETKAKTKAQRVLDQAHEQVQQDIAAARKALRKDTIDLVALATEKVVREKINSSEDKKLVKKTVEEIEV
jgi:F-type H+-transporting ATPase subunit b